MSKLLVENTSLESVAEAIRNKCGTTEQLIFPEGFVSAVESIDTTVEEKDVIFLDYDGTLLYSYTLDEFKELTDFPPLPSHEGLICQGWNKSETLAELQAKNIPLDIGALYVTDDGATRIYIRSLENGVMLNLKIAFRQTIEYGVQIDWGDGSPLEQCSGTNVSMPHIYDKSDTERNYVISISQTDIGKSNNCKIDFNTEFFASVSDNLIYRIEFGPNVDITGRAFKNCFNLETITLPDIDGITIGIRSFDSCRLLKTVIFPSHINISDGTGGYTFFNCNALKYVVFGTSFNLSQCMFQNCHSLKRVNFNGNVNISSIPRYMFADCYSLSSIFMPPQLKEVETYAFNYCCALTKMYFPSEITQIQTGAFMNMSTLKEIEFAGKSGITFYGTIFSSSIFLTIRFPNATACSTLSQTTALGSSVDIFRYGKIVVPAALLNTWKSSTDWQNYSSYIVSK